MLAAQKALGAVDWIDHPQAFGVVFLLTEIQPRADLFLKHVTANRVRDKTLHQRALVVV